MRICYVLNSGSPGGVEQHVLDLIRGFSGNSERSSEARERSLDQKQASLGEIKNEIFVICPWGEMAQRYFEAGAEVRIDAPKFDIDPFYILRLACFLRKNKIDILHTHQLKTAANALLAAAMNNALYQINRTVTARKQSLALFTPLLRVSHVHTPLSKWRVPGWKKMLNIFVYHYLVNWFADKEIALTESVKKVKMEEGIREDKLVVIPNGISLGKFENRISKSETNKAVVKIGTLSRLTVEKNVECFVDAIAELRARNKLRYSDGEREVRSELRCADKERVEKLASRCGGSVGFKTWMLNNEYSVLIGGDGALREHLEQQAQEIGVDDQIEFLGFVEEKNKVKYLRSLDIFVMPSLAEGFGISLIEAMAAGCACIASNLPVLKDVAGDTALYFDPQNPKDLAEKIAQLVSAEDLRKNLSNKGRHLVEQKYTMERFINEYFNLYGQIVG